MSEIERQGWACFHCGEHFGPNDEAAARRHFGPDEGSTAACLIKGADHGLLRALRDAEASAGDAWHALHDETTDAHKALYAAHSRHGQALTSAEESGYERGLADAREEDTRSQSERVSRLEEALKPFAREADRIAPEGSDSIGDSCEVWQVGGYAQTRSRITYGNLRRARSALNQGADDGR